MRERVIDVRHGLVLAWVLACVLGGASWAQDAANPAARPAEIEVRVAMRDGEQIG